MIRKILLLITLILSMSGCSGIVRRKDRHHRAPFENSIEKKSYDINLYSINYPTEYNEKIDFYNDFNRLMIKLLAYDSTLNILYPKELKEDIVGLEKDNLLPEEEIFAKSSSELSQFDKEMIDSIVKVEPNKNKEDSQYYLSKQIYFLLEVLNKTTIKKIEEEIPDIKGIKVEEELNKGIVDAAQENQNNLNQDNNQDKGIKLIENEKNTEKNIEEKLILTSERIKTYDPKDQYSELDKEKLLLELKERRKSILKLANEVHLSTLLRIKSAYDRNLSIDSNGNYWDKKDIYMVRETEINPEILKANSYTYIEGIKDKDIKKIQSREINFNSKVVVLKNKLYNGYTVVDGKYVFFTGGKYNINYYDGYKINLNIKDVKLVDLLSIDDNILLTDFLNPKSYVERQAK